MTSHTPRVSIVMPCFQGAAVLERTVRSVMAQSFEDFELVIIDDHSSDGSAEVAKSLATEDSRIRVLVNDKNLGAEGNWNRALEEAQGEFVKLLCSDDLLHPNCLERQVRILADPAHSEVVLVSSKRDIVDPNGEPVFRSWGLGDLIGTFPGSEVVRRCILGGTNLIGEPSIALFRRTAAAKAGRFSAKYPYMIDLDYWFRLLQHGEFLGLDETLASFRIWPGSWSTRLAAQQFKQADGFFNEAAKGDWAGVVTPLERLRGRAVTFAKCHLRRVILNLQKLKK